MVSISSLLHPIPQSCRPYGYNGAYLNALKRHTPLDIANEAYQQRPVKETEKRNFEKEPSPSSLKHRSAGVFQAGFVRPFALGYLTVRCHR